MKALNIIICLLAVTLFVACSKKKDGNSNPYYPNGTYGLAPNDLNRGYINNGIPTQNVLPGYQLPQGCGTGQLFPDALSYCGWLATDGERVCNPLVVKQMFLQYCQSFAVQFNYCVPQVQSGCYYGSGCSFGTKTIRYHDRPRPRDDIDYLPKGKLGVVYSPAPNLPKGKLGVVYSPAPKESEPVYVQPAPKCYGDKNKDCKEKYSKSSKKASQLICKHPNESASEENYLYTYDEYLNIVAAECNSKTITTATTAATSAPTVYAKLGTVYSNPSSTGASTQNVATTQKAKTVYVSPEDLSKTNAATTNATKVVPKAACLNLQQMHEAILDPVNKISSLRVHMSSVLTNKNNDSENFVKMWRETAKDGGVYRGSVQGRENNNLSAIGYNVKQTAKTLSIYSPISDRQSGLGNSLGKIIGCNEKQVVAKFRNRNGSINETVTYDWNGYGLDDDMFDIRVTRQGVFKYGKEQDTYLITSYIGTGIDMGDQIRKTKGVTINHKIVNDMKAKGYECDDMIAYKNGKPI